jgi:hypothetical protein
VRLSRREKDCVKRKRWREMKRKGKKGKDGIK